MARQSPTPEHRTNGSSLSDRATAAIRDQIISNRLRPGEPLSENQLAKQLGISRTPVREALRQLEMEGLVRLIPGRGAFVAEVSLDDLREIFDLRKALETLAVRSALDSIGDSDIDELEARWEEVRELVKSKAPGAWAKVSQLDNEMHCLFTERCNNNRLKTFARVLQSHIARYQVIAALALANPSLTIEQHVEILGILRQRNPARAADALLRHIEQSEEYIRSRYSSARSLLSQTLEFKPGDSWQR